MVASSLRSPHGLLLLLLLIAATLTGISAPDLFGPDEPREAEIAREMVRTSDYAVPRLLGRPFLEKPPLYYASLSLLIRANGINSRFAPLARVLSVCCGWLILACTYVIAQDALSSRSALLAVLLTMQMPAFWKYSHTIVRDIALAAATTAFMLCYYYLARGHHTRGKRITLLFGAGVFLATAFLIKSAVPIALLAPVILVYASLIGRKNLLRDLCSPWFVVPVLTPVIVWSWMLFREGGVLYLHEHFVMNLLGRFLNHRFSIPGSELVQTDVGRNPPWFFYIVKMPEIYGLCALLLPWASLSFAHSELHNSRLSTRGPALLFCLWAILPFVLLSIASNKERSYLLPALPGAALCCAVWIEQIVESRWASSRLDADIPALTLLFVAAYIAVISFGSFSRLAYWLGFGFFLFGTMWAVFLLSNGRARHAVEMGCAAIISCMMFMYAPGVQRRDQANHTLRSFVPVVWHEVGNGRLYLYAPDETLSGSMAFEVDRDVTTIGPRTFASTMRKEGAFCLLSKRGFASIQSKSQLRGLYTVVFERQATPVDRFVLIRSVSTIGASWSGEPVASPEQIARSHAIVGWRRLIRERPP